MADLSNLGTMQPSSAGRNLDTIFGGGEALENRLSGAGTTQTENLAALGAARAQETPGLLDKLLSPESIALLLGGGAAAAMGEPALGAGIGLGTLEGAGADVQQAHAAKQQEIDRLLSMIDKQQQRNTQLLVAQPGLFIDEEGEQVVSPERLGVLQGSGVPLHPAAMLNRRERDAATEAVVGTWTNILNKSIAEGNQAGVRQAMQGLDGALHLDLTGEAIEGFMSTGIDEIPASMFAYLDPESVILTLTKAHELNVSPFDPQANNLRARTIVNLTADNAVKIEAAKGLELAMQRLEKLPAEQKAYYRTHQGEFWNEILAEEPDLLLAVKQTYTAARQGDLLATTSLEAMGMAMSTLFKIEGLELLVADTPERKAAALADLVLSIDNNLNTADRQTAVEAELRRLNRMTPEELAAEAEGL